MNGQHDHLSSEPLRQVLREWRVETSPPPRFAEGVWRRIEREERPVVSPWTALGRWVAGWLVRPALASAFMASVLAAGLAAGFFQAQDKVEQTAEQQRSQYLRSVNPYFVSAQHLPTP